MGSDVEIVGYVRTGYNSRNLREIKRDVEVYKSWNGIKVDGGKYPKLDGIFYDETSDTTTTRLKAFATYAKSAFGASAKVSQHELPPIALLIFCAQVNVFNRSFRTLVRTLKTSTSTRLPMSSITSLLSIDTSESRLTVTRAFID